MQSLSTTSVFTALITPMDDRGQIDFKSFERLLLQQQQAGNGVLLCGSTGEGLALSLDEKKAIATFAARLQLSVPLMLGVGGHQLEQQLQWIAYANTLAIDAFLLVHPLYAKPGVCGQISWFKALLDKSQKPCMLYNVPSRTGGEIALEVIGQLGLHKNCWAFKEASGSITRFKEYQAQCFQNGLALYSGDDVLAHQHIALGAVGVVSVTANLWPAITANFIVQCVQGKAGDTNQYQQVSQTLFSAANPIPLKSALAARGDIVSPFCRPPLSTADMKNLDVIMEYDRVLLSSHQVA